MSITLHITEQRFAAPLSKVSNTDSRVFCPDMVALVGYSDTAKVLSPLVSAFDASLPTAISRMPNLVGGQTNITAGVRAANDLLSRMPNGLRRRIWLLSDGLDNLEVTTLSLEVARSQKNRTNINTIGFGLPRGMSSARLRAISAWTHAGRYVSVDTMKRLDDLFRSTVQRAPQRHQGEATVFCIDLSSSMHDQMEGRSKIEVVRQCLQGLLLYKQKMWS